MWVECALISRMKLQVTVELDDWFEGNDDGGSFILSNEILDRIIHSVYNEIWTRVLDDQKKKLNEDLVRMLTASIHDAFMPRAQALIEKILVDDAIPVPAGDKSNSDQPLIYFVRKEFERTGWSNPQSSIEKVAKALSSEIKDRYDLMFASQLVAKLNDAGMLKPDVAKLILPDSKGGAS